MKEFFKKVRDWLDEGFSESGPVIPTSYTPPSIPPYVSNSPWSWVNSSGNNINVSSNTIIPSSVPFLSAGAAANYGNFTFNSSPPSIVSFFSSNNREIVKLNLDGSVTWANGIKIDEAAEAFSKSFTIGGELAAGITAGAKSRMRDSIFSDLIEIAKEKGSLSSEDLTYLLQASKIIEKLKGVED